MQRREDGERELLHLLDEADDMIYRYEYTPERRFTFVNAAFERVIGYSPEEHYRDPDLGRKYISEEDLDELEALLRTGQIAGPLEQQWHHKDGHTVWIEQRNVPILDEQGRLVAVEGISRDITSRKLAETERSRLLANEREARDEAEEARRHLEFLADASAQLASSLDYEETLSRIAELAVPRLADWCVLDLLLPDGDVDMVAVAHSQPDMKALLHELRSQYPPPRDSIRGLWKVLRSGEPEYNSRIEQSRRRRTARDDRHLQLIETLGARSSICVALQARGRTLGALTLVLAHSGRNYEPVDLRVAQDLANRCALALDNALLYREQQQLMQLRESLVAGIVHDLKNPLTSILGFSRFLISSPRDPDLVADLAGEIATAGNRLTSLLDEMLDASRLEAGHTLDLQLEPLDLMELLRTLAARDGRVTVMGLEDEVSIRGDEARMTRVFANILDNALKYSPLDCEVAIEAREAGDQIEVEIRDRGIGIAPEDQAHLFERFYRGQNARDRAPGTGLGMWGSRLIVEAHSGSIEVESEEGKGTTVRILLPRER